MSFEDSYSITRIEDFKGKRVEIIAFGIAYRGTLEEIDLDRGTVKLVDGEDFVILEIERIQSFMGIQG